MLDIQLLRNDIQTTAQRLAQRGFALDTDRFGELEGRRKQLQIRSEELQAQRNSLSKQIGVLMGQGKKDEAEAAKAQVAQLKTDMENIERELPQVQAAFEQGFWFVRKVRPDVMQAFWAQDGRQNRSAP